MGVLKLIIGELIGMFIDDEFLAVAVLAVATIAAVLSYGLHLSSVIVGAVLLTGCVAVLVTSALKAIRND